MKERTKKNLKIFVALVHQILFRSPSYRFKWDDLLAVSIHYT